MIILLENRTLEIVQFTVKVIKPRNVLRGRSVFAWKKAETFFITHNLKH